ncbi:Transposase [Cordylochernes scorpioides]|uniref:Transposase n=1 Tax=Cordylochernes scorpioides TaxID=51811 RepID=A0ABY6KZA8_9ARAC|nr:Transposase [Cordylochernes scorpioides]
MALPVSWETGADYTEDPSPGADEDFTVIKSRKRRRNSADSPTAAKHYSNPRGAGATPRPRSSTGWLPRAEEIKTTRAHIAEARARQASSAEDNCVYVEYSPELEPYHYIRAVDRIIGGTNNVYQVSKINGHYLMGPEQQRPGRAPHQRRPRGRRHSLQGLPIPQESDENHPGPYIYNDGRRDAFIVLHEGVTTERLPTRLEIKIKGEVWPAYLSYGIRCSRCHGQGHRRANCPLLHGQSTTSRRASPPSTTDLPPLTAHGLPGRSSAAPTAPAPTAPAPPSPALGPSGAPPDARIAFLSSMAPRPSTPALPASFVQVAAPAPPPEAPAPEHPTSPRSAATEPTPPARPDFTTPCGPLPAQWTLGPATHTPDVDMTTTEETSASSPAAVISTLPLPAPRPAGPTPPVPHEEQITQEQEDIMIIKIFRKLKHMTCLKPLYDSGFDVNYLRDAILFTEDRASLMTKLSPALKGVLAEFLGAAIELARGYHHDNMEECPICYEGGSADQNYGVTSARVDRRILRQAVAAPQATCTAILQHVQDTIDHSISTRTISRRLVANGLHSCLIVAVYACGVDVEKGPIRQQLWNAPTVRQRGIIVWGAIAYDSRSPLLRIQGTMTAQRYVDDVLRLVTLPYLQGVPNALYQQDNARPHTARISQQALQDVQMLPWPPYSPDLSPIEHVWDIIGRRLHALPQPRSEDELWQMVEREWRAIPQDAIRTLIDSLPKRVAACIAVRGGPTCY